MAVQKKIKIDFTGVDKEIRKGGKSSRVPEGDYLGKVVNGELRKTKDGSGRYYNWRVQIVKPVKYKGKTLYHNTSLKPEALWNLRNLVFACLGKNVAGKVLSFEPSNIYNKAFAFTAVDDEYTANGKTTIKSVLEDIRPKAEFATVEDDDDEDVDEDEEEEEDDDEELEDVDVDDI